MKVKFGSGIKVMKITNKSLAVIAVLGTCLGSSGAAHAEGLLESCSTDIAKFCSEVTPGNGRVISCLYAHEDKLTESCDAASADFGDMIDSFFFGLRQAYQTCAPDIEKHCSGVKMGQGRLISCLAENQATLGKDCGEIVSRLSDDLTK
jgi:hypothetical protein